MPSAGDRTPSALSSTLSGRRIISRIASPFSSKSRSIGAFSIDVTDPHRQYSPGDVVVGSVRLRILKPCRVTHIVVSLHGYVQVFKNPGSPGEGFRANNSYIGTGRGKKSGEYFGNGFASLFEDEVVLCGDGRLAEGSYQFNFELQFPDKDLPSSIDFERGTISYMISATMTRPTTMSPTMVCDQKVYFVEKIDISPIYPPKPRTIMLESVSKRSRARHQARKLVDSSERRSRRAESSLHSDADRSSIATSLRTNPENPISPTRSEISFDSAGSSNGQSSQFDANRPSLVGSDDSKATAPGSHMGTKTITATVEPLTGGCLRGDNITIQVNVNHTKPIKSIYGVIATLYRQARVDMHPAIPLGPTEKGTESKYEDYYPKSITGLGGLSLSGAGSNHLFRKDLTQTMVPLYIDPGTLTAEVSPKVRVPDEAFPTISCVPGAMISFKYFVEVLVDIQGRLGSQDRTIAGLGLSNGRSTMNVPEGGEQPSTSFGSALVDTAPIRRDKGVLTCTFEIVVGTRDSARRKGKQRAEAAPEPEAEPQQGAPQQDQRVANGSATPAATAAHPTHSNGQHYDYWHDHTVPYDQHYWPEEYHDGYHQPIYDHTYDGQYHYAGHEPPPPAIPIPIMPDESQMSEKERIRQAEARLLPSAPPGVSTSSEDNIYDEATAPDLSDDVAGPVPREQDVSAMPRSASIAPAYEGPNDRPAISPSAIGNESHSSELEHEASAPSLEDMTGASNGDVTHTTQNHDSNAPSTIDSHADAAGSSDLPRYER
ncbi:ph-response sensor protein [Recurvomyces mirabilis]|uniref:Ph-response sensor protein n=1 Tax=Recurvomyces mirabilis TaxID=574656 RepID=A0AAE1C4G8_9PEZI|nr:ph-response sensor protein [Recurvomyces mirabilis]KAK5157390.1 ph-response sensor protein [Recurvomyces mirabilis]